jgi:hypothetical protein
LTFQLTRLTLTNDLADTSLVLGQNIFDTFGDGLFLNDDVLNTNSKTLEDEPVVHDLLSTTQEVCANLFIKVFNDDVVQTLACCTNYALV